MSMAKQQSITFRGAAAVSSVLLIILLLAVQLACSIGDKPVQESFVQIWNGSGFDVRFEQVLIDDQVIGGGPHTIISSDYVSFRSSTGPVQLKLTTINELEERETVSCTLAGSSTSNRPKWCRFRAYYYKGRLQCSDCEYPMP